MAPCLAPLRFRCPSFLSSRATLRLPLVSHQALLPDITRTAHLRRPMPQKPHPFDTCQPTSCVSPRSPSTLRQSDTCSGLHPCRIHQQSRHPRRPTRFPPPPLTRWRMILPTWYALLSTLCLALPGLSAKGENRCKHRPPASCLLSMRALARSSRSLRLPLTCCRLFGNATSSSLHWACVQGMHAMSR